CAKIHLVKNKYAGKRGKCPACGSWMIIPTTGLMPSMMAPRPAELGQAAAAAGAWTEESPSPGHRREPAKPATRAAMIKDGPAVVIDEVEEVPPRKRQEDKQRPRRRPEDDELEEADAAEKEGEPGGEKPQRYFSPIVAFLLVLGTLTVSAVIAAPF